VWVDTASDEEIERLAGALADGGSFLMPLDAYGFSRRFAWVQDRYGVSWQLNLA
jgi:predicted 3-demethylubiquinone-9 3-methyltransferase (glyoxalase superfamily)